MEQHARIFAELGHDVTVLTGSGSSTAPGVHVEILPPLRKDYPMRSAAENELAGGAAGPAFAALVSECETALLPFLEPADHVFVHNVLTMPFHLACTVALRNLAGQLPAGKIVNWVHDLAALNPDYAVPATWPWNLLRQSHPAMRVVAISEWMASRYGDLTGKEPDAVIPNGIDPAAMLNLTPNVSAFAEAYRLLEADCVLFQPARVLRRKNIELGFYLVEELKSRGWNAKLIVSGALDEHNTASQQYQTELIELRRKLRLEENILFANQFFPVTKADLLALYAVTDVVWFPSHREGFGLPLLEGALHRLTLFCADAPPMNTFALPNIRFFPTTASVVQIAVLLLKSIEENKAHFYARKSAVHRFGWAALIPQLEALLTPPTDA